jgi:GH35 family endo-1,4-beta-xylanase
MLRWAAVVAAGLVAVPTTAHAKAVDPEQFGLHVSSVAGGMPSVSVKAVRLWDAGVRWDQIEKKQGTYKWGPLDAAVANAQAAGATEILYVLGSTPKWAASTFSSVDLYGAGTSSLPKKNKYYLDYAKAVAARYKGRITSYQIWNEANTRSFYNGGKFDGWIKLAALTKQASKAIGSVDSMADIVAASSTVIPTPLFQTESFFYRYLRELKRQKAPIDALSVHLYPVNPKQGPDSRVESIAAVRKVMAKVGLNKPLWDTEVNYGDRRDPARQVVPKPKKAAAYVSRTFLDSQRYGIARTFWYGWDINVLGISLTNADGSPTAAGQAYLTTRDWMLAGDWKGCKDAGGVTTCRVGTSRIVFAAKAKTLKVAAGTQVCRLSGSCAPAGATVKVTTSPLRLS